MIVPSQLPISQWWWMLFKPKYRYVLVALRRGLYSLITEDVSVKFLIESIE